MGDPVSLKNIFGKIEELLTALDEQKKLRNITSAHLGEEALALAKTTGNKVWIEKACSALTHYYSEITNEFAKSIQEIKSVLLFYNEQEDAEMLSEFYRRIGLNYDYLGGFIESKDAYDESIRLLENKPNLSTNGALSLARSYLNESIIYNDLGLHTLSKDYLQKSFAQFQKVQNKGGLSRCYISFGVDAYHNKNEAKALEYYKQAVTIAEEMNDIPPYCIGMANSAIVHADMGRKAEAIGCIEKAIARVQNQVNKHFELSIYQLAGRTYQVVGEYTLAEKWFMAAADCYTQMGKAVDNYELFRYWSETLTALGRHEEANEKLFQFIKQREELHKLNKLAEINDTKLRLQLEEGKKEQELLKKKNAEIEEYTRKLETSNFELKQFAHVASHDMKEPLRMVTNYSQLLTKSLGTSINKDQSDYLRYLNDGAKRMLNVINSLLQLSKINAYEHKEEVSMNTVLEEVNLLLAEEIKSRNAKITSDTLPTVFAERIYLIQLLQNMISNGIKYNNSPTPQVHITYTHSENEHRFCICDNGIGIAPQYREKVFIMFQRLHKRDEYDGSGIGLAICKKIVDSLNGRIWIEDCPLGGTKFCFTIPE